MKRMQLQYSIAPSKIKTIYLILHLLHISSVSPYYLSNPTHRPAFGRSSPLWADPQKKNGPDWAEAELTLADAPDGPHPSLRPEAVVSAVVRSLQFVDHPTESAGLDRSFGFFAWECRKTVTARRGGDDPAAFRKHGLTSPALQPFMGATRVDVDFGGATFTPACPPTRGEMASFAVRIVGAPATTFRHSQSGIIKDGVATLPQVTEMVIRLERQRRPPVQGCWLVREVLDVRHAFAGDSGNAGVA